MTLIATEPTPPRLAQLRRRAASLCKLVAKADRKHTPDEVWALALDWRVDDYQDAKLNPRCESDFALLKRTTEEIQEKEKAELAASLPSPCC